MNSTLERAFIYWRVLKTIDACGDLEERKIIPEGMQDKAIRNFIEEFALEDTFEQLATKQYREQLTTIYGTDMDTSPLPICRAMLSAK